MKLSVSEIFGPTIQGEGKSIGRPTMFLRLGGCNLHCHWCDTPYTWRFSDQFPHDWNQVFDPKEELHLIDVDEVFNTLVTHKGAHTKSLVISGGEPMLQQRALIDLVGRLRWDAFWWVELETAGTIAPVDATMVDRWTISPKLKNSGNDVTRINTIALREFEDAKDHSFKFVASTQEDLDEIDHLVMMIGMTNVYLMPLGIDSETLKTNTQFITQHAIERGYHVTTRLQIDIWGNKRGH